MTGRGTGIDDATHAQKVEAIETALRVNHPDRSDGVDLLATVGGFEIGVLAGAGNNVVNGGQFETFTIHGFGYGLLAADLVEPFLLQCVRSPSAARRAAPRQVAGARAPRTSW